MKVFARGMTGGGEFCGKCRKRAEFEGISRNVGKPWDLVEMRREMSTIKYLV